MSGNRITDQQVRLYMTNRKHHSQEIAAAKAGISVRTAALLHGYLTNQVECGLLTIRTGPCLTNTTQNAATTFRR